jgi:hypothetical protein
MTECTSCEALAKQLAETEKKLVKAEKEIERLEKLIAAIADFSQGKATKAAAIMRRGNIGRAEYGFNHAEFDFGNVILNVLGLPEVKLKKKLKGVLGFGQGLFEGLFGE